MTKDVGTRSLDDNTIVDRPPIILKFSKPVAVVGRLMVRTTTTLKLKWWRFPFEA